MSAYALIPALPFAAALVLALGGRSFAEKSHRVGIAAVAGSFGLSLAALAEVARNGPISVQLYRLLDVGDLVVDVGLYADQLAVLILPLVTGVSFVVHVYSSRYMTGDPRYRRFFALIALFTSAMMMLVMSNNLLVTYMCWEIMGICSYLLISHWAARPEAGRAATKAFLVNAVADVGLGFGVVLTFATYGTLDIQEIISRVSSMDGQTLGLLGFEIKKNTLIALCLLSGAAGKSAQVPMHVWLPFAMEAPTPVSALIHAATMVNAGPFLLVRFSPLLLLSPTAMVAVAVVGGVTALYGALVALTQSDIKKLLAYSTISQIGFMIFACGVGAFSAAIFHLLAHGFLKGFLFLASGDALKATGGHGHGNGAASGERLRPLALGALVLACIPPLVLFSGPYEQIWIAQQVLSARVAFWVIALATVFLTALYVFRGVVSLFGQAVGGSVSARPKLLSVAHVPGLAALAVAGGVLLAGVWSRFSDFLGPALPTGPGTALPAGLSVALGASLAAAVGGWGFAYYRHLRPATVPLASRGWAKTAYVLLLNKLYFDEIHRAVAVDPTLRFSRWLWSDFDLRLIDRAVHGIARLVRGCSGWLERTAETKLINRSVHRVAGLAVACAGWLERTAETKLINRSVHRVAGLAVAYAGWLERSAETGVIGRAPEVTAGGLVRISGWLWRIVDRRGTDESLERFGRLADDTGKTLQRIGPRTLRHHLVIIVCWLVLAISLTYWLVM